MRKLAYIKVLRPANMAIMGIGVFTSSVISRGETYVSAEMMMGAFSCALFTAFANLTNDIIDVKVDKINEPSRPIPSGMLNVEDALNYSSFILALAIAAAAFTSNIWWILITPLVSLLCVLYNIFLKRKTLVGNLLVSFLVALSFIGGGLIAVGMIKPYLILISSTVFTVNLGREVHKAAVDLEGDAAQGVRTVATVFGVSAAKRLASLLYLIAVLMAPLPLIMGLTNDYYAYMMSITCGLMLSSIYKILRTNEKMKLRAEKELVRIWMLLALATMIIGGLKL